MEYSPQTQIRKRIKKIKHIFGFVVKIKWFVSALIALSAFYLLKRFAFDIVKVNNLQMATTYHFGDAVLINKISNDFTEGDIIYIEYPVEDTLLTKSFFFQRIAALPGDSFEISNKQIFRNGVAVSDTSTVKHNFFIQPKEKKEQTVFKLRYNLTEGGQVSDEYDYCYSLTGEEFEMLKNDSLIKTVALKTEKKNSYDETCFPSNENYRWNMDHYGKIYIPKINDTLRLDSININLYTDLISHHEKNHLETKQDSILINGVLTNYYVVKKNYYFVLGDNRDNANDSRSWGFLPENLIQGKAIAILKRFE
ncbi:signal peptidase I [Aurantibacillus circumpalustris]|uniref:signal peptidase I n=1 Tax=Aurantibacillus circumpalustris TaxID=3036359 RepID=UPI00295A7DD2|nr:signal peptidase I [Aurantibacillus circumpalustris]